MRVGNWLRGDHVIVEWLVLAIDSDPAFWFAGRSEAERFETLELAKI
jgi:hypothetical protein